MSRSTDTTCQSQRKVLEVRIRPWLGLRTGHLCCFVCPGETMHSSAPGKCLLDEQAIGRTLDDLCWGAGREAPLPRDGCLCLIAASGTLRDLTFLASCLTSLLPGITSRMITAQKPLSPYLFLGQLKMSITPYHKCGETEACPRPWRASARPLAFPGQPDSGAEPWATAHKPLCDR